MTVEDALPPFSRPVPTVGAQTADHDGRGIELHSALPERDHAGPVVSTAQSSCRASCPNAIRAIRSTSLDGAGPPDCTSTTIKHLAWPCSIVCAMRAIRVGVIEHNLDVDQRPLTGHRLGTRRRRRRRPDHRHRHPGTSRCQQKLLDRPVPRPDAGGEEETPQTGLILKSLCREAAKQKRKKIIKG